MAEDDWAELGFREDAAVFKGPTQNARVWTEGWVEHAMFCPNCGAERIRRFANNSPVADFGCEAAPRNTNSRANQNSAHPGECRDPDRKTLSIGDGPRSLLRT